MPEGLKTSSSLRRRLVLAAACLALAGAAGAALVTAISGGSFLISSTAVVSGGARSTGGGKVNVSAIGGHGTIMSGGAFTLYPGALASVRTASLNTALSHAYPTPFEPAKGHDRITFTRLPPEAVIRVYTVSGRLVKTLSKNDSTDSLIWRPVANEQGTSLVSGVYLFVVSQPGFPSKRGKLMILK